MARVVVCPVDEVKPGQPRVLEVDGREIAVFCEGGAYFAIDNLCPHRDGPLAEGTVEDGVVTCPWHWARFRLATGEVCAPPATRGVRSYPVSVEQGQLVLEV